MADAEKNQQDPKQLEEEKKKAAAAAEEAKAKEAELTKYKTAAEIANTVIQKVISKCVAGANVMELCIQGDELIEQGLSQVYNKAVKPKNGDENTKKEKVPKGIAFPTSIGVNNCVGAFSPLASDPLSSQTLQAGDVVKVHLGAHIDGFASVTAETIVIPASSSEPISASNPVTGVKANVIKAAYTAAEVAMRTIKVGGKNWDVTDAVEKVAKEWGCRSVEGMLSCNQTQNVIDGKKRVILNPSEAQKREMDTMTFAEGEVWGMDVLISSGDDGKSKPQESRPTIYQRDSTITYQLKMKTSRGVFSEVQKKAGAFPFNVRCLETDEKRVRMGLQEAVQHGLVREYEVAYTSPGTYVAHFHFTLALLPSGPSLITAPPTWYNPSFIKTEKEEMENEDLRNILRKGLRENKKKKKKDGKEE